MALPYGEIPQLNFRFTVVAFSERIVRSVLERLRKNDNNEQEMSLRAVFRGAVLSNRAEGGASSSDPE